MNSFKLSQPFCYSHLIVQQHSNIFVSFSSLNEFLL